MDARENPLPREPLINQEISLYQELLDCLEQEARALGKAQEEMILSLAAAKEKIVERLLGIRQARESQRRVREDSTAVKELARLRRQVAARNARNHAIISASLEVIQEFLAQFYPPGPGLYQPGGQVEQAAGRPLFHRQA
jgi:flagellar biosynthesis/type III secretory pathway chaperone